MQYYPSPNGVDRRRRAVAAEPALRRALQQGPVLELGRQGRSQLQPERPHLLPLGRERAQRSAQHHRHPQRPGPGRPAAADPRPTAPSSATGCTSSAAARCSTSAAATPTTSSGASPTRASASIRASSAGRRASSRSSRARARRHVPAHRDGRLRQPVARHRARTRNRNYSIQPNISLTRGKHNIRSGLDMRWTNVYKRQLRQRRRLPQLHPAVHPQHDQQHQRAGRQLLRVVPARRARQRRSPRQRLPALPVVLHRARGSRTTGASATS